MSFGNYKQPQPAPPAQTGAYFVPSSQQNSFVPTAMPLNSNHNLHQSNKQLIGGGAGSKPSAPFMPHHAAQN